MIRRVFVLYISVMATTTSPIKIYELYETREMDGCTTFLTVRVARIFL